MNNRMAVRTDRPEVPYWIDHVFSASLCNRLQVMDMDKALGCFAINLPEGKTTGETHRPVVLNALSPSFWIALVDRK